MVECVGPGNQPGAGGVVSGGCYAWAQNLLGVTFPVNIFNPITPVSNGVTGWKGQTANPGNVVAGCAAGGIIYPTGQGFAGGGGGVGAGSGRGGHGSAGPSGAGGSSPTAPNGESGTGDGGQVAGVAPGQNGNTVIIWPLVNAGIGSGGGGGTATVNAGNGGLYGGGAGMNTTGGPNNPVVQGRGLVVVTWPFPLPAVPPGQPGMAVVTA